MAVWSKPLAVALSAILMGFGATAVQADDYKDYDSCQPKTCEPPSPPPICCPAPVITPPAVEGACCELPVVEPRCPSGCGVFMEDFNKAQKEALHAQKHALKARDKQQKAIAKAREKLEKETAKQQAKIDKATEHLNHEANEFQAANARYESLSAGTTEAVAVVQPTPEPMPAPAPAPEISESKPEEPVVTQEEPVIVQEEEIAAVVEPAPTPTELPKTASPMGLMSLIGLASMASGMAIRFFRN